MSNFQFKIEDRSTTFDEKDVWADDKLGFCDDAARRLNAIVSGQELPLTICLNGTWGSGKTFFLTRFVENYNKRKPEGRAVYFNAWQDDFLDDPLLAIIGQLKKVIKGDSKSLSIYQKIKSAGLPCLLKGGISIAKQLVATKTNISIDKIKDDIGSSKEKDLFDQYHEMNATRDILRMSIAEFARETFESTKKPLLFVVDELDRCRPTFAIEVLERIKHLFNVPHLVFLIGADLGQLGKSIKAVYGDIDSVDYLHRFLDIEVKLPVVDKLQYVYALWEEYRLEKTLAQYRVAPGRQGSMIEAFASFVKYRNVTLRQIEKCVRTYALLAMSRNNATCNWALLAAIAVVFKVTDPEAYVKFIRMEFRLGELIDSLYPNAEYDDIDRQQSVYNVVSHLIQVAYYSSENSTDHLKLEEVRKAKNEAGMVAFDSDVMPKCFQKCTGERLAEFYRFIFRDASIHYQNEFKIVPQILSQMHNGLEFIV